MEEKPRYNPYSTVNALLVSLVIALLQYLLITTTSFLSFQDRSVVSQWSIASDVIISYIASVVLLFVLFKFSFWVAQKNIESHKKHLLIFSGLMILTVPLSLLSSVVLDLLLFNPIMYLENIVYKKLVQDIVYAFIVFLITISIYSIMRNQKVEADSVRNRYAALKSQLDPHFLFNSLNALDGLIGYDDEKAHHYLQKLSQTFRYIIQNKEITELSEELKLVDAYYYLMKIRYGDNLTLNTTIDDHYHAWLILPISLQSLLENAIKHNTINDKHPLTISIETTAKDTIKVTNNKNPKLDDEESSGIGLSNLLERYVLMFEKEVKITDSPTAFCVEIPLIELKDKN